MLWPFYPKMICMIETGIPQLLSHYTDLHKRSKPIDISQNKGNKVYFLML